MCIACNNHHEKYTRAAPISEEFLYNNELHINEQLLVE